MGELLAAIEHLDARMGEVSVNLTAEVEKASADARKAKEQSSRSLWWASAASIVGIAFVLAVVVVGTVTIIENHSQSVTVDAIHDCTNAGGQCWQDTQRQSNARLAPIISDLDARLDRIRQLVCALFATQRLSDCPPPTNSK